MKNFTILTLILGLCTTTVYAATYLKYSRNFIKNFKDCDSYSETITTTNEERTFQIDRKIIGWKNGFCKYQEIISSDTGKYKLDCNFTDIQIDDLYSAMKSKSKEAEIADIETYQETTDKDGQKRYSVIGTMQAKGNKAFLAWTKVQNNPYFCKPEKLK